MTTLKDKFERLNQNLKIWNINVFGLSNSTRQSIIRKINESNNHNEKKIKTRELSNELKLVSCKQEAVMKQKAKASKWINKSDSGARYF